MVGFLSLCTLSVCDFIFLCWKSFPQKLHVMVSLLADTICHPQVLLDIVLETLL